MLYMMEWALKSDSYDKAHNRFLEEAAPMPEGATLLGRWHAPGSVKGWLLVETDKPETIGKGANRGPLGNGQAGDHRVRRRANGGFRKTW